MSDRWDNRLMPDFGTSNVFMFGGGTALPEVAEDQGFVFDPSWAMPYSPVTQRQYLNSQFAAAANGLQVPTPLSSHPPSVWTDNRPPSVNTDPTDPLSAGVLDAPSSFYNHPQQVVVDQNGVLNGIDVRHNDKAFIPLELSEEDLRVETAQNVVAPSPNPGPSEAASQMMPTQTSMGNASQDVVDALALLGAATARLLAQKPTPQSLSPTMQGVDSIRRRFDEYIVVARRREMPPPDSPSDKESDDKKTVLKGQLYYRCPMDRCKTEVSNRAVMKRHADTMHFPQYNYYCHHKHTACPIATQPKFRRDKLIDHYQKQHREFLTDELKVTIDAHKVLRACEAVCICGRSVADWDDFYECFLKHCECEPPLDHEHRRKRRRDDSDGNPFDPSPDNGGPAPSKQGNGRSGNFNGRGQHHSFSGTTGNHLNNGDSKPLLRARSASDSCDARTKCSRHHQRNDPPVPISEGKPSGSGNNQSGWSKKKSTQTSFDLHNMQGEAGSQSSVNNCQTCQHPFNTCVTCSENPPSGYRCHACPPLERSLAMQVSNPHADLALRQSLLTIQNMGFAEHIESNPQGIYAGPNTPATVDPALIAMEHHPWQLDQARLQRAQAPGSIPRRSNQQRAFGENQRYMAGAVHNIQVRGMSELDMKRSIMDSMGKWDSKKTPASSTWSVVLPFRNSPPPPQASQSFLSKSQFPIETSPLPLCKPLTSTGSISVGGMEIITRKFIGPPSLKGPSSACQCACRTMPAANIYFARGRVDIAPSRQIEVDFRMAREAPHIGTRGMGHPLRTRVEVVVKMLKLRTAAKSASDKQKQETCVAYKGALEATVYGPDAATTTDQEDAQVVTQDNSAYDWEIESVAESTATVYTRASTGTDINSPRTPSLAFSRTSSTTELTIPSRSSSPGFLGYPRKPSCADLKLPPPARSRSPLRLSWDDDTISNEERPIQDVDLFEKEEDKGMEHMLESGLRSSLDHLSHGTGGVPADELRSAWDFERVSQYIMGQSLSVIFSRASRGDGFNPSWEP